MGIVKKRKLLTKEQELKLFEILRSDKSTPEQKAKAESVLVVRNLGLVLKSAKRWAPGGVPLEDLVQEGALGLVRAIRSFDPSKGCRFSTHATNWVRRDVGRFGRTKSDVVHVPEHVFEAARLARKAVSEFEAAHGREPSPGEFEAVVGMTKARAEEAFQAVQKSSSLHAPVGDEGGSEMGDLIEDQNAPAPSDEMERAEAEAVLSKALRGLSSEERMMLALKFGVVGAPMTPASVAGAFGVPAGELEAEAARLGLAGENARPPRA